MRRWFTAPRRGFTLVELIVVLIIVGVLAAIASVAYTQVTDRAHVTRAEADLRNVAQAILVAATVENTSLLDRALVTAVLEDSFGGTVTDGIAAADARLGYADQAPQAPGDYSVGFYQADGSVDDAPGSQAVLLTATVGQVLATTITVPGTASGLHGHAVQYPLGVTPQDVAQSADTEPEPAPPVLLPALVKILAPDAEAGDRFGQSIALDGDTLVIGAPYDDTAATNSGAVYVFARTEGAWTPQAKLTAADASLGYGFGTAVAIDGNTLAVGATGNSSTTDTGVVYTFVRSGVTWTQQQQLTAADASPGNDFGGSVALDGDTLVVAARADGHAGEFSGAAYVFARTETVWGQQAKLTANDAAAWAVFGSSVDVEGDTVVVGSPHSSGGPAAGAYVFSRSGGDWSQQVKLTAPDAVVWDLFGKSVALDGDLIAVGAPGSSRAAEWGGAVYTYTRDGTGLWAHQDVFTAPDATVEGAFGQAVSVAGNVIAVGAPGSGDAGSAPGVVYAFTYSAGGWDQQSRQSADAAGDEFAWAVALDGTTAAVSAYQDGEAGVNAGAAYIANLNS